MRGSALLDDHRAGRGAARSFFAGSPSELSGYLRRLDDVKHRFDRAARERAAAAVRPTSPSAATRLRRFVEEGGAMVTTGQQTGLFTGPAYTIHKALTAIRLAAALEEALGIVVLPLFWCASEDHDFAEISHTWSVDGGGGLVRHWIRATDPRPLPMSGMALGSDVAFARDRFIEGVERQGIHADHLRSILAPYSAGSSVATAFRSTVEMLFAEHDLLVTDAADPTLKRASIPVLQRDLAGDDEVGAALTRRTGAIEAAGYAAQVTLVTGAANVFHHGPAGRERLQRDGDGWRSPVAGVRLDDGDIERRIVADPAAFSPGVLLRPVVEAAVFPTLAYVGGPAEIAYLAQAGPLFAAHGIAPPIAFPRFSATVTPDTVADEAADLGLDDPELARPEHEIATRMAARRLPAAVGAALGSLRERIVAEFGAVMDAATGIDANLEGALGARRNRALLEAARAERTILAHWKRSDPAIATTMPRIRNHRMPMGQPQERVLNLLPYLAMRPTLLDDLAAAMVIRFDDGNGPLRAPAARDAATRGG